MAPVTRDHSEAVPTRLCVVGAGRMGLPVALQFAGTGAEVVCADTDGALVAQLEAGVAPFADEPEIEERLAAARAAGRFRAVTDTTEAVRSCDAVIVLVRLVTGEDGQPDYRNLDLATRSIAAGLQRGALVCYETTLPVGDTRSRFGPMLGGISGLEAGLDFSLCFSPERVSSGRVFHDLTTYPKIVGGLTPACAERARTLFGRHLGADVKVLSSLEAAELTKIAETTYRNVNIALANELAQYADEVGANFSEVADAANSQPYSRLHQPGVGVGGHCIPVYPRFFTSRARSAPLVNAALSVNEAMPRYAVHRLEELMGPLRDRRVLVLGAAFRPDIREASHSTVHRLVAELTAGGAEVRVEDPLFGPDGVEALGYRWEQHGSGWADGAILNTAHGAYRGLLPADLPGLQAIVDGRGALDESAWRASGVRFAGIGR